MTGSTHVALVTGASSGIGREFARILAEEGCTLFLVSRSEDELAALGRELETAHGIRTYYAAADLASPDGVETVARAVAAQQLGVDLLINNAGFGLLGKFAGADRARHLELIRVNVEALVDLTHRFVAPMIARGHGGVINVASMAAFTAGPLMSTYYASKAFVVSFSEALSRELRETGVTISVLCPGPVATGFQARAGFPQDGRSGIPSVSARRVAEVGLKGHRAGKRVVVPGLVNRILAVLSRFAPHGLRNDAVYRVQSSRLRPQR